MPTSPTILVVGGAGYIGSHTCLDLAAHGYTPVVFDDLSKGHEEFVQWGPLERGNVRDAPRLDHVFRTYEPAAVVHFAAWSEVGESVRDPLAFYTNNVAGSLTLLAAMERAGCDRIVFSSTCATYGEPERLPLREDHRQAPLNPYGRTKLMVEDALRDLAAQRGLRFAILRYFNAAGADARARIGEWHEPETHAIPLAIETALGRRGPFSIFGTDYATPDGTCIRDFVHVADLADAHSLALRHLLLDGESLALNFGTGTGTSVRDMLRAIERRAGHTLAVETRERRKGDAPVLVADNALARERLGWAPRRDLETIVDSAWNWHERLAGKSRSSYGVEPRTGPGFRKA